MGSSSVILLSSLAVHVIVFGARLFLVDAFSSQNTFAKVSKPDLGLISFNHAVVTSTNKKCSLECLISNSDCKAFAYDTATGTCTLGSRMSPNATLMSTSGVELYTYVDKSCDNTLGYWRYTFGSISACLYLSVIQRNYQTSSDACKAIGGRLFAVKTLERMRVLQDMLAHYAEYNSYWVGLDDRKQENNFLWSDGTTLTAEQKSKLFLLGQPDDSNGNEDCVGFRNHPTQMDLDDIICTDSHHYVCEPIS